MPHHPPTIAVSYENVSQRGRAEAVAAQLGLALAQKFGDPHPLHLAVAEDVDGETHRLELRVVEPGHELAGGHGVFADLTSLDTTSPAGRSLKTPLLKAVGINRHRGSSRPRVLDATAGLGEDAWLLAAAGCEVTAVERHPVIHALLADALRRARTTAPVVADRITLANCADAEAVLRPLQMSKSERDGFDVVLIDPMFPGAERRKTTERKPMRVLRGLAGDDADADKLLDLALCAAIRRVVVKRPRRAPALAGREPGVVHAGRGLRFDVYPVAGPTAKTASKSGG